MNSLRAIPPKKQRQHGAALMVMLVILILGVSTALVGTLSSSALQNTRQESSAVALAQAKDALIGYAITYGDINSGKAHGYLPCPDTDNDGSINSNQSPTQCAVKNIPVVGRLPWKSLGLPPLRGGHGECLWYAVSGTFKAVAGGQMNELVNWDTAGQFTIQNAEGVTLAGATAYEQPVAVIFSANSPLGTQSHPADSGQECSGGTSNSVSEYLEGGNAFTPPATPPESPIALTHGSQGSSENNDVLLWITPSDIFSRTKKRNDFDAFVMTLLSSATTCLSLKPPPVTIDFDTMTDTNVTTATDALYIGRIPLSVLTPSCTNNDLIRQWRDNLLYAICTSGACLTGGHSGVVIFTGERNASLGQERIPNTEKNTWSNYLEDLPTGVLTAFSSGDTDFSGASTSYNSSATSEDVVAFIP